MAIVLLPLAVGVISASFAGDQMQSFGEMNQPPLSPPGWLFPVAWTILYIMMGFAFWMISSIGIRGPWTSMDKTCCLGLRMTSGSCSDRVLQDQTRDVKRQVLELKLYPK
ncbi:MAG: tryptophan-rich sensory protein [Clostridiales bacterium]|nr:tryptophan-rich sensory protein [Candidatus Crickella caballi]